MAYLGFLLNYNSEKKIILIEKPKLKNNIIIGTISKINIYNLNFLYLTKKLEVKNFLVFKDSRFMYGKISLSQKTCVNYEDLTIWFSSKKFKELRQLFDEKIKSETELIKRTLDIYNYFK